MEQGNKIHVCKRCLYQTKQLNSFRGHLTRKNPCQVVEGGQDIASHVLLNELCAFRNRTNEFSCPHCNTGYTCRTSLYRHNRTCTARKTHLLKESVKDMGIMVAAGTSNNLSLEQIQKTLEAMNQRLDDMAKSNKAQTTTTTTMNAQRDVVNNTMNININIVAHGQEDTSYIPHETMTHCVKNLLDGGVNQYWENVYKHPEHPENHNIRGKSKKQNILEVYDGANWKLTHANTVLDNLIQKGCKVFYNHLMCNMNLNEQEEDVQQVIERQLKDLSDVTKKRKSVDYYKIRRNLFFMFFQDNPNDLVLVIEPDGQDIVETTVNAMEHDLSVV